MFAIEKNKQIKILYCGLLFPEGGDVFVHSGARSFWTIYADLDLLKSLYAIKPMLWIQKKWLF